jgi:hypothetical protein
MTPEELNRTIEFIIQSQARVAASQEQDREEFKAFDRRLANLLSVQVQLLTHQTERLDAFEKESHAAQRRHEEMMARMNDQHKETLTELDLRSEEMIARLDRILDKLTDRLN